MSAVRNRATEVVFVLLPDVVLLDVAGPADAFRNAASRIPGSYRLRFVAPQPALAAAVGLNLSGLEPLPDRLAPGTILVLTGVSGALIDPEAPALRCVIEWLRESARPRCSCVSAPAA
jgi:transcriptional regulator GlxA family with amidase domain